MNPHLRRIVELCNEHELRPVSTHEDVRTGFLIWSELGPLIGADNEARLLEEWQKREVRDEEAKP